MYLLDTNILAELLLVQEKADEVEQLLRSTPTETFYFDSDFDRTERGRKTLAEVLRRRT